MYNILQFPETQIVEITSTLDQSRLNKIMSDIDENQTKSKKNFVVDFSSLTFLNSNGINLLLSLLKRSNQEKGKIALANVPSQVEEILSVTKLRSFFTIKPSVQDALICISNGNC